LLTASILQARFPGGAGQTGWYASKGKPMFESALLAYAVLLVSVASLIYSLSGK